MLKALTFKELREIAVLAALSVAAFGYCLARAVGYRLPPGPTVAAVPFLADRFTVEAGAISFCLAVLLGFAQSYLESMRGAWTWLFFRPISRRKLIAAKLCVGAAVYLLCSATPLLAYAWWASLPDKHAGPFEWSMTADAWRRCLWMLAIYFGSFLSGIWPGRWLGTRLLPLIGVAALSSLALAGPSKILQELVPGWWNYWSWAWLAAVSAGAIYSILYQAKSRDFS